MLLYLKDNIVMSELSLLRRDVRVTYVKLVKLKIGDSV